MSNPKHSKPKHTPGPWKVELHEGEYLISGITDGKTHFTAIAHNESNARLIAAAPEMLEALKKAYRTEILRDEVTQCYMHINEKRTVESVQIANRNLDRARDELRDIRESVIKAIDKVEGRER